MNSVFVLSVVALSTIGSIEALPASSVLINQSLDDGKFIEYVGKFGEKSFYAGQEKTTRHEALKFCEDFGMKLVAFNSYDELDFVTHNVEDDFWTSGESYGIWKTTGKAIEFEISGQPVVRGVSFGPGGADLTYAHFDSVFRPLCEK